MSYQAVYTFSITRLDALALGGAGAAAFRIPALAIRLRAARGRLWWTAGGVLAAGGLATSGYPTQTWVGACFGYTFLAVGFVAAVAAAATGDAAGARSSLTARPLRAIGKYSYGMYVFHKPLHDFVGRPALARLGLDLQHDARVSCLYIAAGVAVTFGLAFVSYNAFERRFLRLKDRFVPRA